MNKIFMLLAIPFLLACQPKTKPGQNNPCAAKTDSLKKAGYNIIDLHAHLKGGLTMEALLEHSKKTGIKYGVAANCGLKFPIQNDSALSAYYHAHKKYPVYLAMQAEGREWTKLFHPDSIALFDYVFTDAMTFYDRKGRRTRLWIKEEVHIEHVDSFMEHLVGQAVQIIENEPIDIFVNPTYLPEEIREKYDELWTEERMQRVINALSKSGVALEINAKLKLPKKKFIMMAKKEGVKFTLGTNNGNNNLGCLEYSLDMIEECKLQPDNFWKPDK